MICPHGDKKCNVNIQCVHCISDLDNWVFISESGNPYSEGMNPYGSKNPNKGGVNPYGEGRNPDGSKKGEYKTE